MDIKERKSIVSAFEAAFSFMHECSGHNAIGMSRSELAKHRDDIYEVFVDIHLTNGDVITLRNWCEDSYRQKRYMGDSIEYLDEDEVDIMGLIQQDANRDMNQISLPLSSVCWINQRVKDVQW